jgi:hypothetical protein
MGITSDVVEASGTGTALGGTRSEAVEISGHPMEIQPSKGHENLGAKLAN